jgi:hypothetical protein
LEASLFGAAREVLCVVESFGWDENCGLSRERLAVLLEFGSQIPEIFCRQL